MSDKKPSFQFYPGDWKGSKWIAYDFQEDPFQIKPIPGVYVIFGDGNLLYVGQSTDVRKRICCHGVRFGYSNYILTPWGNFSNIKIKIKYSSKFGDWAMIEQRLIYRLSPPNNRIGILRGRSKRGER